MIKIKLLFGTCLCMMFLVLHMGNVKNVQAATKFKVINANLTFEKQERTVGKTTFEFADGALYAIRDGKKILLASDRHLASGGHLSSVILTNGTKVHYNIDNFDKDSSTVYYIASLGKKGKKQFSANKTGGSLSLKGLFEGKIYYVKDIDPGTFCSYTIRTNKKNTIKKNVTEADQYKQYFYLMPYFGGGTPGWLRVYNAKNNEIKLIAKKQIYYNTISNQVYYAEVQSMRQADGGLRFCIDLKKSNFDGGNQKILVRDLDVQNIVQVREHSLSYIDLDGKEQTKRF